MYRTHYTLSRSAPIESVEDGVKTKFVYVVGHSLGNGWTRHIVELQEGETADNPASTKGPLYGPALVVYDVSRTNIHVHVHKDAEEFYTAIQNPDTTTNYVLDDQLADQGVERYIRLEA